MLTDQEIYNIAEWLAYNRDVVLITVGDKSSREGLLNAVQYITAEHFRQHSAEDVLIAFNDERILFVFDFYYVHRRDKKNEH